MPARWLCMPHDHPAHSDVPDLTRRRFVALAATSLATGALMHDADDDTDRTAAPARKRAVACSNTSATGNPTPPDRRSR